MANVAAHKESLVRTAMRLFRRQGYASTGLQQILTESGAPKGSLYHYFPRGKEELGEAAVDLAADRMADTLSELARKNPAPDRFLRAYARTMAGWMEASEFRSGCPVATTLLETAPASPRMSAAGERAFDRWVSIIAGVYESDGTPRREARRTAEQLLCAMEGALILSRVRRSSRPILDVGRGAGAPRRARRLA